MQDEQDGVRLGPLRLRLATAAALGDDDCMRRLLLLLLAAVPGAAAAADRTISVSSFTRVRVEGPFVVEVRTGVSPVARASGDEDSVERVEISQSGDTVTIRPGTGGWGERPTRAAAAPVTVSLGTPRLEALAISAGAQVRGGPMKGQRVDLAVTGAGKLSVERVDADQLAATVVGAGSLDLAGKAATARLWLNGEGAIVAPELSTGDLTARVEGVGSVTATARFTANVTTTGLGKVTVLGAPKCQIRAPAGGTVMCGVSPSRGETR